MNRFKLTPSLERAELEIEEIEEKIIEETKHDSQEKSRNNSREKPDSVESEESIERSDNF